MTAKLDMFTNMDTPADIFLYYYPWTKFRAHAHIPNLG